MGDGGEAAYEEVPIHGPAGTVCIADRCLIHTRLDPLETDRARQRGRRILHHVYSNAGSSAAAAGGGHVTLEVTEWAFSRGLAPRQAAVVVVAVYLGQPGTGTFFGGRVCKNCKVFYVAGDTPGPAHQSACSWT